MLIKSHRHTKEDLEYWDIISSVDTTRDLSKKIKKSKEYIREFQQKGRCYVGTSWGKDSVVVASLASCVLGKKMRLVNIRVIPNRNPYCNDVRDEFLKWYSGEYKEVVVDYRPVISARLTQDEYDKETNKLFFEGFRKAAVWCGTDRHISGVRASESNVRKLRCMRWGANTNKTCAPIAWWSSEDVFAYLAQEDLPIHPNYAMCGGGRWTRTRIRTAEIGDVHGTGIGRREWEAEYYPDVLRRSGII